MKYAVSEVRLSDGEASEECGCGVGTERADPDGDPGRLVDVKKVRELRGHPRRVADRAVRLRVRIPVWLCPSREVEVNRMSGNADEVIEQAVRRISVILRIKGRLPV
ncbi:MAG TPA: hypothetical protein VM347_43985 [Nonomuraea sp.]|nr:hypothetical protein [Nonomuraea sp.]